VRQLFYTRFSFWHSSDTVRRHSVYYDVRIKKHVRLHVPYFTELLAIREKPVEVPGWRAPKLGVHNTAIPGIINAALRLVSQKQLLILLIKHIIFYIHCINLSSFHVLVTLTTPRD